MYGVTQISVKGLVQLEKIMLHDILDHKYKINEIIK